MSYLLRSRKDTRIIVRLGASDHSGMKVFPRWQILANRCRDQFSFQGPCDQMDAQNSALAWLSGSSPFLHVSFLTAFHLSFFICCGAGAPQSPRPTSTSRA